MYKVQIKGLEQGKTKLKDGSFAVAFKTLYGKVWITKSQLPWLFLKNPHLEKLFRDLHWVQEEDLVGRYLFIKQKEQEVEIDGMIFKRPVL